MDKNRKKAQKAFTSALKSIPGWMALAFICTGCHYDSKVDFEEFRVCSAEEDLTVLYAGIQTYPEPLTLEEIFEISSSRNLNILVKELEYQIQTELVTREKFGMLPDIRGHFESLIRNRNTASSSESLVPGVPPAPLSISSQKHQWRWDYALVWNYVDFGLSFLRSRQEYNRALKLQFEYQRVQQNLYVEITRQYWKAQTAKLARLKSRQVLDRAKVLQEAVRKQLDSKIISEIQGLRNEGQLITFQAQFQYYDKEYHTAMSELALSMGLPPCIEFELADVVGFGTCAELGDICELETLALYNRPELYSNDAEELIQRDEARAAVLQMYPGVDLFAGHNHDSNRFLLFNHWIQAGTRAAYNLLDWPRHLQESRAADGRVLLAKNNRLLMSVSVMTQVHLAYSVYLDNLQSYKLAKELENVNVRLLKASRSEQKLGKLHDADVMKYEIELLESQIDSLKQYGELQNSLEQLNNSLGLPRYYSNEITYGVMDLSEEKFTRAEDVGSRAETEEEEVKDVYLDYIIERLEQAESRSEGLPKHSHSTNQHTDARHGTHDQAVAETGEKKRPSETVDPEDPWDTPYDDVLASEGDGKKPPVEPVDPWDTPFDDVLAKYQLAESDRQDSSEINLEELSKKYGLNEEENNQPQEENHDHLPS